MNQTNCYFMSYEIKGEKLSCEFKAFSSNAYEIAQEKLKELHPDVGTTITDIKRL